MSIRSIITVGALACLTLAACSSGGDSASDTPANQPDTVDIAVVPQMKPVADKLAAAYRTATPGKKVSVTALSQAAIAKAAADKATDVAMAPIGWLGSTPATGTLGRNLIVVAVPASNPGNVAGLAAFGGSSRLRTSVCGVSTYLGDFTLAILRKSNVSPGSSSISTSADCPQKAMTALAGGQLDAAVMFRNNVTVPSSVRTIAIPAPQNLVIPIQYAVVQDNDDAKGFGAFLASDRARTILTANGYLP